MVSDLTEQELKQWQKEVRSRKSAEFGEVGKKTFCEYFGENSCGILTELVCETGICYFYANKYRNFDVISEENC